MILILKPLKWGKNTRYVISHVPRMERGGVFPINLFVHPYRKKKQFFFDPKEFFKKKKILENSPW